jgi:RES domain
VPPVGGRRRHRTKAGNPVLDPPPASFEDIEPELATWHAGAALQRVYSPEPFGTEALTFRTHGPHNRFDHQRPGSDGEPQDDADRGIMYAGDGLVCCLGEFFADSTEIAVAGTCVATVRPVEQLRLLDLRGTAATGVGTTQAIAAISQRRTSQAWARYLYDHPALGDVHGLLYTASNSGLDAVAFFERAEGSFEVAVDLELNAPALEDELELAADALHWPIAR